MCYVAISTIGLSVTVEQVPFIEASLSYTGFFRLSAQSIVRPWAFIKGGRLIGPYRETHTVHLVYFNICTDMIVQFNTHPFI